MNAGRSLVALTPNSQRVEHGRKALPESVGRETYACINRGDALCSDAISGRAICIDGDIAEILSELQ